LKLSCSFFDPVSRKLGTYQLNSLAENATPVRNMKQYLLAMLYNAPTTMNLYYQNKTNHDFARGLPKAG